MTFRDNSIRCGDCGKAFVFGAGEHEFFSEGLANQPGAVPRAVRLRRCCVVATGTIATGPGPGGKYGPLGWPRRREHLTPPY